MTTMLSDQELIERWTIRPGDIIEAEDIDLDETVVIMDGKRYTEADAAQDAQYAEAYWAQRAADRQRGLTPGGKSLSKDGSHSPTLTVTLPADIKAAVVARAQAEGMSASKWVRRALTELVAV